MAPYYPLVPCAPELGAEMKGKFLEKAGHCAGMFPEYVSRYPNRFSNIFLGGEGSV